MVKHLGASKTGGKLVLPKLSKWRENFHPKDNSCGSRREPQDTSSGHCRQTQPTLRSSPVSRNARLIRISKTSLSPTSFFLFWPPSITPPLCKTNWKWEGRKLNDVVHKDCFPRHKVEWKVEKNRSDRTNKKISSHWSSGWFHLLLL